MTTRKPLLLVAGLGALALGAQCAHAGPDDGTSAGAPAPWMVAYPATKDCPVGMDESAVLQYLDKTLKSTLKKEWVKQRVWDKLWSEVFTLMTPAWKTDVPAFALSRYEVTNAQWEKFLEFRQAKVTTAGGETLASLAASAWGLDPDKQGRDVQQGWQVLLHNNAGALKPVLNPKDDPKWDPLMARAADAKLPKGLELSYPRYLPPLYWKDGVLPAHERKKPIRMVTWEMAADFCRWAGLHLPAEHEWERAARGTDGRLFAWGNEWDPLRAAWVGLNAAAIEANKPEIALRLPGQESDPPKDNPCPADVDTFRDGATPEGVLHMTGNVSEFTMSRSWKYAGTKSKFPFAGETIVARGGNFTDHAEMLLAADRCAQGPLGALLSTHATDGLGFRAAAYPVAGADLTALAAERYADTGTRSPYFWLPAPAGMTKESKNVDLFRGFSAQRTAGILERQLAAASDDHVFVTGPATGIAFLPVRGLPMEEIKSVSDLQKAAKNPDARVLLGVLTGTEASGFAVTTETKDERGDIVFGKAKLGFGDRDLFGFLPSEYAAAVEPLGATLLWDGEKVLVYRPNASLSSAPKYHEGLLGTLDAAVELAPDKGISAPAGKLEGDVAVLSTTLPLLDNKGREGTGSSAMGLRITIRVPFVREMPKK